MGNPSSTDASSTGFALEQVEGVDVSSYQPDIDWQALYASGRRFMFARVADGSGNLDCPRLGEPHTTAHYAEHRDSARAAKFLTGAYIFFRAGTDLEVDAQVALLCSQLDHTDLPPVLDCEDGSDRKLAQPAVKRAVLRAIEGVQKYAGRVMVYTSVGWWEPWLGDVALPDVDLWIANYGVKSPLIPRTWKRKDSRGKPLGATIWQYTGSGTFPGLKGKIDMNLFRGSESDLRAWAGGVCAM